MRACRRGRGRPSRPWRASSPMPVWLIVVGSMVTWRRSRASSCSSSRCSACSRSMASSTSRSRTTGPMRRSARRRPVRGRRGGTRRRADPARLGDPPGPPGRDQRRPGPGPRTPAAGGRAPGRRGARPGRRWWSCRWRRRTPRGRPSATAGSPIHSRSSSSIRSESSSSQDGASTGSQVLPRQGGVGRGELQGELEDQHLGPVGRPARLPHLHQQVARQGRGAGRASAVWVIGGQSIRTYVRTQGRAETSWEFGWVCPSSGAWRQLRPTMAAVGPWPTPGPRSPQPGGRSAAHRGEVARRRRS